MSTPFIMSTPFYVNVSLSVWSHPKAPPAKFFLGAPKYDPSYVETHFPLVTLTFRVKYKPVEIII